MIREVKHKMFVSNITKDIKTEKGVLFSGLIYFPLVYLLNGFLVVFKHGDLGFHTKN